MQSCRFWQLEQCRPGKTPRPRRRRGASWRLPGEVLMTVTVQVGGGFSGPHPCNIAGPGSARRRSDGFTVLITHKNTSYTAQDYVGCICTGCQSIIGITSRQLYRLVHYHAVASSLDSLCSLLQAKPSEHQSLPQKQRYIYALKSP